jgi:D-lactate dehydrogenase (cytochrome)
MPMTKPLITPLDSRHQDYLRDESRRTGRADSICFPASEADVIEALGEALRQHATVTIQGGRTGITAGAVPEGGCILNLSRMKRISGLRLDETAKRFSVTVQPGVLLSELTAALASLEFDTAGWSAESLAALAALRAAGRQFFPVDPTETSATIGGMVACNASGSRTFLYGSTRDHVESLSFVVADGTPLHLRRGEQFATGRSFALAAGERRYEGRLPAYRMPQVKNAAGYHVSDEMDLLDLFIGMEGTLAVITEIELRLTPLPPAIWGLMAFMPSEAAALKLVRALRAETVAGLQAHASMAPAAMEYFNADALTLLRCQKNLNPAFAALPDIDKRHAVALYVEYHGDEERVSAGAESAAAVIEELGGDGDSVWLASDDRERERMRFFRHAVPESVNLLIDERRRSYPELTKLGTDMSVPDERLEEVMALYSRDLAAAGLESIIFGHIGNNHVHVNILPRTPDEYQKGKQLYLAWARQVVTWGGSVSAEHGIGKLKREMLQVMYGEEGVRQMRELKSVFDPYRVMNKGNLFE